MENKTTLFVLNLRLKANFTSAERESQVKAMCRTWVESKNGVAPEDKAPLKGVLITSAQTVAEGIVVQVTWTNSDSKRPIFQIMATALVAKLKSAESLLDHSLLYYSVTKVTL